MNQQVQSTQSMQSTQSTQGASAVLPYIVAYHALKAKRRGTGRLSQEEKRTLELLREIFEPVRVTERGLVRQPVSMTVFQPARFTAGDRVFSGRVCSLNLRRVMLLVGPGAVPPVGASAVLEVQGMREGHWFSFVARVRSFEPATGRVTLRLELPVEGKEVAG